MKVVHLLHRCWQCVKAWTLSLEQKFLPAVLFPFKIASTTVAVFTVFLVLIDIPCEELRLVTWAFVELGLLFTVIWPIVLTLAQTLFDWVDSIPRHRKTNPDVLAIVLFALMIVVCAWAAIGWVWGLLTFVIFLGVAVAIDLILRHTQTREK